MAQKDQISLTKQNNSELASQLYEACEAGDLDVIQDLVDSEGKFGKIELNKALITVVKSCRSTATDNYIACMQLLLKRGANINAED